MTNLTSRPTSMTSSHEELHRGGDYSQDAVCPYRDCNTKRILIYYDVSVHTIHSVAYNQSRRFFHLTIIGGYHDANYLHIRHFQLTEGAHPCRQGDGRRE